jgi:hypothetical protein
MSWYELCKYKTPLNTCFSFAVKQAVRYETCEYDSLSDQPVDLHLWAPGFKVDRVSNTATEIHNFLRSQIPG